MSELLYDIESYSLTESALDTGVFGKIKHRGMYSCIRDEDKNVLLFDTEDDFVYYLIEKYGVDYDYIEDNCKIYYHLYSEMDKQYYDFSIDDIELDYDVHTSYFDNNGEVIYV